MAILFLVGTSCPLPAETTLYRAPTSLVTQLSPVCRRFVADLKLCGEFAHAMLPA